jgi:uncharacterized OsmC-like protein
MQTQTLNTINGLDLAALDQFVGGIRSDPSKGFVRFRVSSAWQGQTRSQGRVRSWTLNGDQLPRDFSIAADEPVELLGQNTAPNPQELLMAALNACLLVGYVANAAIMGVNLASVEIESEGELDLRGFLGIDPAVKAGYDSINYRVLIKGDGTAEQYQAIHENVVKTSPNYFNISRPVQVNASLVVL